jgi:hypothetical protein
MVKKSVGLATPPRPPDAGFLILFVVIRKKGTE